MKLITFCVETLLTTPRDKAKECNFYSLGLSFLTAWLVAGMDRWVRNSEFSPSLYSLLANCRPYTAVTQFLNSPAHPAIESTHITSVYLRKVFFFFFLATPCSFYGSLVLGIKPGSSAVRAWSPNPLISREFPVYLQRALGELRGKKKKSSWLTQNILVQDIRKRVWKGDWKLNINFFFLLRENIPVKKHSIYLMINMYVHMQGVYINSCWGRK